MKLPMMLKRRQSWGRGYLSVRPRAMYPASFPPVFSIDFTKNKETSALLSSLLLFCVLIRVHVCCERERCANEKMESLSLPGDILCT